MGQQQVLTREAETKTSRGQDSVPGRFFHCTETARSAAPTLHRASAVSGKKYTGAAPANSRTSCGPKPFPAAAFDSCSLAQRQRVRFGSEEQQNERAISLAMK